MANRWAVASGNWSNTATWNGGTLPTSADVVYSNTFNVNIDVDFTVLGLSSTATTGVTAGGTFTFNTAGVTGTVTGGTVTMNPAGTSFILITATTGTVTFTATNAIITSSNVVNCNMINHSGACNFIISCVKLINGSTSALASNVLFKTSTGNITFTGDIQGLSSGNSNSSYGFNSSAGTTTINGNIYSVTSIALNQTGGTLNITGNLTGPSLGGLAGNCAVSVTGITCNVIGNLYGSLVSGSSSWNALIAQNGSTVNITGNVLGGLNSAGIGLNSTSVINITGTVTGGSNAVGASVNTGTLNITGTINGGTASGIGGASTSGTGTLNHIGTAQASAFGSALVGGGTTANLIATGPFLRNGYIVAVASQSLKINSAYNPYFEFKKSDATNVTYVNQSTLNFPAVGNVRLGTSYASGLYTGTLNVPTAAQVLAGIPVDATTGTLLMTPADFWNYLIASGFTTGSIGERLQNASTVATTGGQIASYNI